MGAVMHAIGAEARQVASKLAMAKAWAALCAAASG